MEHKQTEDVMINVVDEAQGIIEAIWAVMGNIDDGNDIIHNGAFTKTFNERGNQVKLLDNHRATSVMDSLGIIKQLREVRAAELPQEIMNKHPDATGGAWGQFQFLLDTPEGKGAFTRIQKGAVQGWSFGYDAVDKDSSTITKDGQQIAVRNLRQIKLYEISPVLFAMNEATTTTDAKSAPSEGKPYRAVEEDGKWKVYKLNAEGDPTGKPLGTHDTEAEANTQIRAIEANEEEGDDKDKGAKAGRVLSARNAKRILDAIKLLTEAAKSGGLMAAEETDKSTTGPQESEKTPTSTDEAGPSKDDDTRLNLTQLIEIELEELEVIECL